MLGGNNDAPAAKPSAINDTIPIRFARAACLRGASRMYCPRFVAALSEVVSGKFCMAISILYAVSGEPSALFPGLYIGTPDLLSPFMRMKSS
jgi:hypothetical protein